MSSLTTSIYTGPYWWWRQWHRLYWEHWKSEQTLLTLCKVNHTHNQNVCMYVFYLTSLYNISLIKIETVQLFHCNIYFVIVLKLWILLKSLYTNYKWKLRLKSFRKYDQVAHCWAAVASPDSSAGGVQLFPVSGTCGTCISLSWKKIYVIGFHHINK